MGAPGLSVEHVGKNNIFLVNAAGAPRNHSYYFSLHDFHKSCIQFVLSSIYLCIYGAIHQHMVYLDWLQVVVEHTM